MKGGNHVRAVRHSSVDDRSDLVQPTNIGQNGVRYRVANYYWLLIRLVTLLRIDVVIDGRELIVSEA